MLDSILTPIATEDFFRRWWTRDFLHIPGHSGKFSHLFPWEVLNRALEEHRFDAKRLVLYKSGKKIESGRYLNGQWVDTGRLVNELSNGCTLIFNACEEVYPPLRDLCVHLEGLVHHRVTANLYAGWRRDNGFNVHWDTQDTMILQVAGRKQWKVWKPAHPRPFHDDLADTSTPPTEAPVWDGTLEPGCLLSIPRGWWHVACPMDEPCLHLTVTVQNLNGIDFLHWLAEQMKSSEAARMRCPSWRPGASGQPGSSASGRICWRSGMRISLPGVLLRWIRRPYPGPTSRSPRTRTLIKTDFETRPCWSLRLPVLFNFRIGMEEWCVRPPEWAGKWIATLRRGCGRSMTGNLTPSANWRLNLTSAWPARSA